MLEGKTRISPVDVETLPDDLRETLEEQRRLRGAPGIRVQGPVSRQTRSP